MMPGLGGVDTCRAIKASPERAISVLRASPMPVGIDTVR